MKNLGMVIVLMISSMSLWSDTLLINIKDVMDLATYKEALNSQINLSSEVNTQTFTIKKWHSCFADCANYHINLAVEVHPITSELIDAPTYVVAVKKVLIINNKSAITLGTGSFTLALGQEQRSSDHYWAGNKLVVRQENFFSVIR